MSDVIEDYIRRNPDLSQAQAFDGFLKQDRIRAWVGDDPSRRDRLHREFARVWDSLHGALPAQQVQVQRSTAQPAQQQQPPQAPGLRAVPPPPRPAEPTITPPAKPTAPPRDPPRSGPAGPPNVPVTRAPPPPPTPIARGRRLQVLCSVCSRYAIFAQGTDVACAACGTYFDDMLGLVPVKPVGPFAFVFGEGWKGVATATGIGLLLAAVYGVLRWL